jgi:hypothetical protein
MDATRRLSTWLRLVCGLVLAVGFSTAASGTTLGDAAAKPTVPSLSHLAVTATSAQSATLRAATTVRHGIAKHRVPAMAGALGVVGLALTGLTVFSVRRRRTNPSVRHHALSHGARAPPAVAHS